MNTKKVEANTKFKAPAQSFIGNSSSNNADRFQLPKISIVGMGYVGLATAICFANNGYSVHGAENDRRKCNAIQSGKSPIHEQGIDSGLKSSVESGNFSCSAEIRGPVLNSEITFLTVGTPSKPNGEIDLKYIESAAFEVGRAVKEKNAYHLIVVKSTVVPGTTSGLVREILEESSGKHFPSEFGLCFNPEFLREGSAIYDTMNPDALIIGAEDDRSSVKLLELYRGFYGNDNLPYTLITKTPNAEFVKYSVNTFRATQLSFLNSLANLCEKIPSADIFEVTKGLSAVTKIDNRYLRAGLGYGGSCLPKDLRALTALYQENGVNASLLLSAAEVNLNQPLRAIEMAQQFLGNLDGKKVAVLGLTFKAGTDDIRESVAIRIIGALLSAGAIVSTYDPKGMESARQVFNANVNYADDAISCVRGTDCCILATEWDEFRSIPASVFKREMSHPIIIDGRRILDGDAFKKEGVLIYQVGRSSMDQGRSEKVRPIVRKNAN